LLYLNTDFSHVKNFFQNILLTTARLCDVRLHNYDAIKFVPFLDHPVLCIVKINSYPPCFFFSVVNVVTLPMCQSSYCCNGSQRQTFMCALMAWYNIKVGKGHLLC